MEYSIGNLLSPFDVWCQLDLLFLSLFLSRSLSWRKLGIEISHSSWVEVILFSSQALVCLHPLHQSYAYVALDITPGIYPPCFSSCPNVVKRHRDQDNQ